MTLAVGALFCPSCASALAPGMAACARCGRAVHPAAALRVARRRPPLVTVLAVLQSLGAVVYLGGAAAMASAFAAIPEGRRLADLAVPMAAVLVVGGFGILHLTSARGLWKLKRYGRTLLRFFAILGLLAFPFGTIVAVAVLVYVNTPGVRLLFSERPMDDLTAEQYAYVLATMRSPASRAAVIVICVLLVAGTATAITASLTLPRITRARIAANEARALAILREFVAAETNYAVESGGYYGTPECLAVPAKCVPGYRGKSLTALPGVPVFQQAGFVFQFTPGRPVGSTVSAGRAASLAPIDKFSLVGVPVHPGWSGERMFCVDSTLKIRWATGAPPNVYYQFCPPHWRLLGEMGANTQAKTHDNQFPVASYR